VIPGCVRGHPVAPKGTLVSCFVNRLPEDPAPALDQAELPLARTITRSLNPRHVRHVKRCELRMEFAG